MRYPLPEDTARMLEQCGQGNRNLGLALDKYLAMNDPSNEGKAWPRAEDAWKLVDKTKRRESIQGALGPPIPTLIKQLNARRNAMFMSLRARGDTVKDFVATPDYRLVVGFGAEHVLEANLCLHRIYGFPIIPGSAVKGVTRSQAFWELVGQLLLAEADWPGLQLLLEIEQEADREAFWDKLRPNEDFATWQAAAHDFYQVFGTTAGRGQVVFFDAYPTARPNLEVDLLNPHYGPYYQNKPGQQKPLTPPADYLSPVPTYFLTVARNSPFQFAVAGSDPHLTAKAKQWLWAGLEEQGIGGKTAAGYGYMEIR